jgi:hypothetical protein
MRRRISYANVTATLALVFAMSGGALAANSYLINSTKQINPKVLKKLTGKTGKTGSTGTSGAVGATGAAGLTGAQGQKGETGPKGEEGKEGPIGPSNAYGLSSTIGPTLKTAGLQTVATLSNLPAGSYTIVATFDAFNFASSAVSVDCQLTGGTDTDEEHFLLQKNGGENADDETATLQLLHTYTASSNDATVACNAFGVEVHFEGIKITAIQVGSITSTGT